MALFRLQRLPGCGGRRRSSPGLNKVSCVWLLPSDSATMMVKKRTAPLVSLNQEQLKRNRMEDEVTLDDLSLTCTLGGGTGGPTGTVMMMTRKVKRFVLIKIQQLKLSR